MRVPFAVYWTSHLTSLCATNCSAGIEQSEDMKRFLWDTHFAAIASDMPALERWPTPEGTPHMHQTLLGYVTTADPLPFPLQPAID